MREFYSMASTNLPRERLHENTLRLLGRER